LHLEKSSVRVAKQFPGILSDDHGTINRARLRRKYIRPAPETDPRPQHHPASFSPAETEGRLHAIIRVSQIRSDMTSAEWDLIVRVTEGFDCQEMALESGVSAGNIRTRLSRLRSRFKMAA
jgi:DNA-directed RNA polymerase specialized sigma24 family protein